jgi:hypothetical protein
LLPQHTTLPRSTIAHECRGPTVIAVAFGMPIGSGTAWIDCWKSRLPQHHTVPSDLTAHARWLLAPIATAPSIWTSTGARESTPALPLPSSPC